MVRWLASLGLALLLAACASVRPGTLPDDTLFHDALFAPPLQPPDATALFAVSPAMKRYLAEHIEPLVRRRGAQMALLDALYERGELLLEYDAARTRTAAEAFDARRGNCLSLVVMTAAFAEELGLHVRFQEVLGVAEFEAKGDLTFVIGHVNLALGGGRDRSPVAFPDPGWLVVDFLPGQDVRRQRTRELEPRRVRALYMNNRAAEELAAGRLNDAYWWARGAWRQDPGLPVLYNTLGVIYRHAGLLPEAERALSAARALDPDNAHVAGNLAGLQRQLRSTAAAGPAPAPSAALERARAALDRGQPDRALALLQAELARTPRGAELHHWIAVASARLGDLAGARRHLGLAAEFSASGEQRVRYSAKLERLNARLRAPSP